MLCKGKIVYEDIYGKSYRQKGNVEVDNNQFNSIEASGKVICDSISANDIILKGSVAGKTIKADNIVLKGDIDIGSVSSSRVKIVFATSNTIKEIRATQSVEIKRGDFNFSGSFSLDIGGFHLSFDSTKHDNNSQFGIKKIIAPNIEISNCDIEYIECDSLIADGCHVKELKCNRQKIENCHIDNFL